MSRSQVGLPEALERAATALPRDADAIRPANGDPIQLAAQLDAAGAVRVLSWLLVNEPSAGEELAVAWAEDPEGGTRALVAIDAEALPKAARKPIRRARHRLRSRGVAVPEREPRPVVAKLPDLDESLDEGCIGPLDPRGARMAYLAVDHPSGGARLFEAVIDDVQGVLEFQVYGTGRSRVRRFLRDLARSDRLPAAAAAPPAIRALIARAAEAHPASRPLPRAFGEWRSRLCEGTEGAPTPGQQVREALAEQPAPDDAPARAAKWVEGGSVGPWPPPREQILPIAERIAETGKGVVVVSAATRAEQVERVLDEALAELFGADFAEVTARRFEESAYLLWRGGREEDARIALAVAERFRRGEPEGNPVARAMLEVLFAPVLHEAREGAPDAAPAAQTGER
jgi:hypothetical protein